MEVSPAKKQAMIAAAVLAMKGRNIYLTVHVTADGSTVIDVEGIVALEPVIDAVINAYNQEG